MDPQAFKEAIQACYFEQDAQLREAYDRSLPLQDAFIDRWERAKRLGFEEGASIYNSALVFGKVSVGRSTWVGPNVLLDGSGGNLSVGAFCSISAGVHIYTHDTVAWALTGGQAKAHQADVVIGDRCHLGAQAIIKAGVQIGVGSVIGANSFVNRDIPSGSIAVGSPAKVIGRTEVIGDSVKFIYE